MEITEDIFRFKRFQILQSRKIHRVGTDGVLLGAWVNLEGARSVVDVGAGTGVISLMLAQRFERVLSIAALEPDDYAFSTLKKNIDQSPFKTSVDAYQCSFQQFNPSISFDYIVCNPPFFQNSLKPAKENRKRERHNDLLPFHDLISHSKRLLNPTGRLSVVLPVAEGDQFISLAIDAGFFVEHQCSVLSKQGKPQERWLLEFSLVNQSLKQTSIIILNSDGTWTQEYQELTREFYIDF